jgi:hypothetical protein
MLKSLKILRFSNPQILKFSDRFHVWRVGKEIECVDPRERVSGVHQPPGVSGKRRHVT